MNRWIKDNLVLVSGIVLPVLLVAGFFILSKAPQVLSDPPRYDFLVISYDYDYQHSSNYTLSFEVRNTQLHGKAVPRKEDDLRTNRQKARIFRYDVAGNSFEELIYDLPENVEVIEEPVPLQLGEIDELTLDKRSKSPDGYQFEYLGYKGNGGLLGDIFGMGRRYESNFVLKKGSAHFSLPAPTGDPHYFPRDLHFMGWITESEGDQ